MVLTMERLGRAVMVRRAELRIERKEVAEASEMSYPYLSEIENGSKYPSMEMLIKLAAAIELSPAELMVRAEALPELTTKEGK